MLVAGERSDRWVHITELVRVLSKLSTSFGVFMGVSDTISRTLYLSEH